MKRKIPVTAAAALAIVMWVAGSGQTPTPPPPNAAAAGPSLQERLGYLRDAKLLIVHCDDLGMHHSIDAAAIKGFQTGLVNSASIMVPCPWFPEIAVYARSHPEADLGLHLTLNSEWTGYRWGPVLARERVPSLVDRDGYLPILTDVAAHADVKEAEAEIRAQIARAQAFGIRPTHLDTHMEMLYQTPALFEMFARVAADFKLPIRIAQGRLAASPQLRAVLPPNTVVLDRILTMEAGVPAADWAKTYVNWLNHLQPGVTEIVMHLGSDSDELRGSTFDHPNWGAAWRQRDYDFFTSDEFRRLLQDNQIKLVTWRQIGQLLQDPAK